VAVLKNGQENRVKGDSLHDIPAACKFFGRRIKNIYSMHVHALINDPKRY